MNIKFKVVKVEEKFGDAMFPIEGGGRKRHSEYYYLNTLEGEYAYGSPDMLRAGPWTIATINPLIVGHWFDISLQETDQ